jgi:hypothetical protein
MLVISNSLLKLLLMLLEFLKAGKIGRGFKPVRWPLFNLIDLALPYPVKLPEGVRGILGELEEYRCRM